MTTIKKMLIFILISILVISGYLMIIKKRPLYISIVGPMSGRDCSDGQAMVQGTLICKNKNILIVLGHFSSSSSFEAGKIYQKMNIPAITASFMSDALINSNDWYFRVIPGALNTGTFCGKFY